MSEKYYGGASTGVRGSVIGFVSYFLEKAGIFDSVGFEGYEERGDIEAKLSLNPGGGVEKRFFDGGEMIRLPFRLTVKRRCYDAYSSLLLQDRLTLAGNVLDGLKMPIKLENARILSIKWDSTPVRYYSGKDRTEEYSADFLLFYFSE